MGPSEVPFEIGRALRLSHGEFEEVSALRYRCGAFDPQRENFAFGISVSFSLSLSLSLSRARMRQFISDLSILTLKWWGRWTSEGGREGATWRRRHRQIKYILERLRSRKTRRLSLSLTTQHACKLDIT